MAGVDLNVYRFDYDLTFVALLMNADGTIYHTYGGRDWTDPMSHLSMTAFTRVLRETLVEHAAYEPRPAPRPTARTRPATIEQIAPMARRIEQGKAPECFHCHMVNDMRREDLVERKRWTRDQAWTYPDPAQVGLALDGEEQTVVATVEAGSASARAGLAPGDRLLRMGAQRLLTFADVQGALHDAAPGATSIPVEWSRGGEVTSGQLRLAKGWKEPTPLVFSWRPSKWPMSPKPGFGGRQLTPDELEAHGLARDAFAFRVRYIVTWGPNRHTGQNAARAGVRKGDVVVSVDGKSDFASVAHFHSWFRLTREPGEVVPIAVLRGGKRKTLELRVVE